MSSQLNTSDGISMISTTMIKVAPQTTESTAQNQRLRICVAAADGGSGDRAGGRVVHRVQH